MATYKMPRWDNAVFYLMTLALEIKKFMKQEEALFSIE